jgi:glutaconate CoA-transferase subunit B
MTEFSPDELMVWTLAREVRPDDVVVVGVATPIAAAAALLARAILVPTATVIVGAAVDPELHPISTPMLKPETLGSLGVGTLTQSEILDQIQRGRITLQFVSPAQVDGKGRLNTSRVARSDGTTRRLPGGLATGDIAVLIGRLLAYRAEHSLRFLPKAVEFVTGAGHEQGASWRQDRGLPGTGVQGIVTDRAVLRWAPEGSSFRIASVHPSQTIDEVVSDCGFPLSTPDSVPTTDVPPAEALTVLRSEIDPVGVRRLEVRSMRSQAMAQLMKIGGRD